jgi:hypothetical protein
VETAAFAASQRTQQFAQGVPAERASRGIAAQVALARRCSPFTAARAVGWAAILTGELPHTFAALRAGRTSEWRAMLVARETAWLSREHRAAVDAELAPRLEQWGDRRVENETKRAAYRLDPAGALERANRAAADRRVTLRPAPETMAVLSVLLPVAQGVGAYAALTRHADTAVGAGDGRSRGQLMADTAFERLTGLAAADGVPAEINLIMTDHTLLGASEEPAHLLDHGPLPAALARRLVLDAADTVPMWIRRLYANPATGDLVTMDSRRRTFTPGQRRYLRLRDQTCRTPWCDAPIRHTDHVLPYENGGRTHLDNGQGYCAACNHAKQAPGWAQTAADNTITTRTPTGATYQSRPPEPPRSRPRPPRAAAPPRNLIDRRPHIDVIHLDHTHRAA